MLRYTMCEHVVIRELQTMLPRIRDKEAHESMMRRDPARTIISQGVCAILDDQRCLLLQKVQCDSFRLFRPPSKAETNIVLCRAIVRS